MRAVGAVRAEVTLCLVGTLRAEGKLWDIGTVRAIGTVGLNLAYYINVDLNIL